MSTPTPAPASIPTAPGQNTAIRREIPPVGGIAARYPNPPLVNHRGERLRFRDAFVDGRALVVSAIYTRCQGSCPGTSFTMERLRETLTPVFGEQLTLVSFTIDPLADSPTVLARYAANLGVLCVQPRQTDNRQSHSLFQQSAMDASKVLLLLVAEPINLLAQLQIAFPPLRALRHEVRLTSRSILLHPLVMLHFQHALSDFSTGCFCFQHIHSSRQLFNINGYTILMLKKCR